MKNRRIIILLLVLTSVPAISFSQNFSDYLILQDIVPYKLEAPQKVVGGYIGGPRVFDGAGVIAPTGHFYPDHSDKTYEAYYEGGSTLPSSTVQVTQHAGSDSDKWLLHEVERGFRRGDYEENMTPFRFKKIDGNNIYYSGLGGGTYRWVSGNVLINVQYTDLYKQKPEPIEVIQAYLSKFPSTIPAITIDDAHNETWIKDEMDRRLWLCDKWVEQNQTGTVDVAKLVRKMHDHMKVFLNYKKKYYGIDTDSEKIAIYEYMQAKDEALMKSKLAEYKTWWTSNKDGEITLP